MTPFVYCSVPARFFQACKALFGSCLLLFALAGCGGGGGEAMVNFDATVTGDSGDVILARSYWGREPLAGADPADGVTALGVAMGEAMGVFAGELAAAL